MFLFWLGLALVCSVGVILLLMAGALIIRLVYLYVPKAVRIFQEKPLFIVPRGQPIAGAEVVELTSFDGLRLRGCYLKGKAATRRGVILFGLEFGSDCWSCWAYVEGLVHAGYDIFAIEVRNQGQSEHLPGYEPLQWVTDYEVADTKTALDYLRNRPDADPRGIGLFGISRGAGAGIIAASRDPSVRCFVTDGMFGTRTTVVPYMKQWFRIYNNVLPPMVIPNWVYLLCLSVTLRQVGRERRCRFLAPEKAMPNLANRPLLMIHGEGDTYIKPDMARKLFSLAKKRPWHEFWLVAKAKHNQALNLLGDEYRRRVLAFFDQHLAAIPPRSVRVDTPPAEKPLNTTNRERAEEPASSR